MKKAFLSIQSYLRRLPTRVHDSLFAIACRVLLPLSTMCKVCNMLRGMAIGLGFGTVLGAALAYLVALLFSTQWWVL